MGIFLPQIVHQGPISSLIPTTNDHDTNLPYNPNPQYETITYNQFTLGMSSPKKDRHTKISTAHGFRDRRVRLSMAIAREFFDLQDMLGFDKASKTIGWLLAKSKIAIQDLALAKHLGSSSRLSRSSSTSCSSHQEEVFTKRRKKCPNANYSREEVENQANSFVARENRAKARARARERTREKLIKPIRFDDLGSQTGCSSQFLTDFKAQEFSRSSHLMEKQGLTAPLHNVSGSVVIRSRHSSSPSISCTDYLQNLLINTSPTDDQINASIRVNNHLPSLLFGSDYHPEANSTSFSEMHGTVFKFINNFPYSSPIDRPIENGYIYMLWSALFLLLNFHVSIV
ncbi:hypothetical protein V2J09_012593 [Rumex salicifolius]